ncbi:MAG: hypothetical protein DCF31_10835 [Alphaproteobacteria bacterium]|nr:MAG: hypothetical protein DCF31_10835 [Alphaproteobacteria bacterium]
MELNVPLETVCRIMLRAREYEALVPESDPDDASNAVDDGGIDALEDGLDEDGDPHPAEEELRAIIDDLADDEQAEVIALALIGGDAFDASEWDDALEAADEHVEATADWILDQPAFSTDLESGLAAFGLTCTGIGTIG